MAREPPNRGSYERSYQQRLQRKKKPDPHKKVEKGRLPARPVGHEESGYVIINPDFAAMWPPELEPGIRIFRETSQYRLEQRWSRRVSASTTNPVIPPPPGRSATAVGDIEEDVLAQTFDNIFI